MSDSGQEITQRAYALIEDGDYETARGLLKNYLTTHRDDADAWWLYAHSVDDLDVAEAALRNVLRVEPNYAGAQEMLDSLAQVQGEESTTGTGAFDFDDFDTRDEETPDFLSAIDHLDDDEEDDFDDFDEQDDEEKPITRRRLLIGGAIILLVVGLIAGLLIMDRARDAVGTVTTATATLEGIVQIPTLDETTPEDPSNVEETPSFVIVDEDPTPEPLPVDTDDMDEPVADAETFYEALATEGLSFVPDSAEIVNTSKGDTLTLSVCSGERFSDVQQNVVRSLVTLAGVSADIEQAQALGVRLIACDGDNSQLRFVTVALSAAQGFAQGQLSESEFAAQWDVE